MASKYQVFVGEKSIGHYQAKNGSTAVEKAIEKNIEFYPDEIKAVDAEFTAHKTFLTEKFTWVSFPELAEKYGIEVSNEEE